MEDIIAWSFETHGIQRQTVVVYGNVYIYVLIIYMVRRKENKQKENIIIQVSA